jgi:tetratricopeptide (TPR) repeat protein
MSKIKTEKNRDNRRDIELPPNVQNAAPLEAEEQTGAEKLLMASQPYWTHIALGVLICILAWVIISYLAQSSREAAAEPSRQLADAMQQFNVTSNVDSLKQMKNDYPNEIATNWAMLIAGDYELNRGLSQFATDREGGMKLVQRAKDSFQSIVDSPATAKTTMQQRRSLYSLAYANESLGEFDAAKSLYQQLLDEAPDSIFATSAQRGLQRASDPAFNKLYDQFATYQPVIEEAPGVAVPKAPDIDFPAIDLPTEEPTTTESSGNSMPSQDEEAAVIADVPNGETSEMVEKPKTEMTESEAATVPATQNAVDSAVNDAGTPVTDAVEKVTDAVEDAVKDAAEGVKSGIESAADAVKEATGE